MRIAAGVTPAWSLAWSPGVRRRRAREAMWGHFSIMRCIPAAADRLGAQANALPVPRRCPRRPRRPGGADPRGRLAGRPPALLLHKRDAEAQGPHHAGCVERARRACRRLSARTRSTGPGRVHPPPQCRPPGCVVSRLPARLAPPAPGDPLTLSYFTEDYLLVAGSDKCGGAGGRKARPPAAARSTVAPRARPRAPGLAACPWGASGMPALCAERGLRRPVNPCCTAPAPAAPSSCSPRMVSRCPPCPGATGGTGGCGQQGTPQAT